MFAGQRPRRSPETSAARCAFGHAVRRRSSCNAMGRQPMTRRCTSIALSEVGCRDRPAPKRPAISTRSIPPAEPHGRVVSQRSADDEVPDLVTERQHMRARQFRIVGHHQEGTSTEFDSTDDLVPLRTEPDRFRPLRRDGRRLVDRGRSPRPRRGLRRSPPATARLRCHPGHTTTRCRTSYRGPAAAQDRSAVVNSPSATAPWKAGVVLAATGAANSRGDGAVGA